MNPVLVSLPVVVIYPYSRCNCRCAMCDIWKRTGCSEIDAATYGRYLRDFEVLRTRWVVFSGGEPLMHPRLETLCRMTRERGIRVTILSSGLLLERHAAWIAKTVDDVIVSLDGPAEVHDRIRGIPGAFGLLRAGVRALHGHSPDLPVYGRCTVQRMNHRELTRTAQAARDIGLASISYLAADLVSPAFDHAPGWNAEGVALDLHQVEALESEIDSLVRDWCVTGFVREPPGKLRRIAAHFRAHLGLAERAAPSCNAPWASAVIETDGTVRPCFFQPAIGRIGERGLLAVINGETGTGFRSRLEIATNEICRRCVCPLNYPLAPAG